MVQAGGEPGDEERTRWYHQGRQKEPGGATRSGRRSQVAPPGETEGARWHHLVRQKEPDGTTG